MIDQQPDTSSLPTLTTDTESIPAELRAEPRWVVARADKVPLCARDAHRNARVADASTWADFETAQRARRQDSSLHLGFVLGDGWVGVDLDHCRNAETGAVEARAEDIVRRLDRYRETRISGTGLHAMCKGALPGRNRKNEHVEMCDHDRYFVMTGEGGNGKAVAERTDALAVLYADEFGSVGEPDCGPASAGVAAPPAASISDDAVLEKVRASAQASKFDALWSGDTRGYRTPSEADAALCAILAFWTNDDRAQMDRLFRNSKLCRSKWEEREDYRHGTFSLASKGMARRSSRAADTQSPRFMFRTREMLLNSEAVPFLVKDILVQQSLVAMVAPPGCNKTFLALDLALSVASGQSSWLGRPLYLQGPVVYVNGDNGGRFKLRVQAWDEKHGIRKTQAYPSPFHYLNRPVALTNPAEAGAFVDEVGKLKPVLVVFDTLSRCLAGADENNQKDMSAAVAVCDKLRQQLGCCVLLLHHTTKDGRTERGSSVLRGAVDTLVVLKVPDQADAHFTMSCDKQKDAEPFAPIHLIREKVTLASEMDRFTGEPAVSCAIAVSGPQSLQRADKALWTARTYLSTHPGCTKTALANHLKGRRQDTLRQIHTWVKMGDISFERRGQPKAARARDESADDPQTLLPE